MVTPECIIRVRNLFKRYPGRDGPVDAVNGLDLDVRPGECFGLLGPNGAGKTTTVEILEGLNRPTSGDVEVLGMRWESHELALRQRIGVTLQETRFPDKSTVREMVRLFRSFYRAGCEPDETLSQVALESKANALVETLSGGQQRRLAVALALVGDPELIFFDEPTTGLDPQSRRQLWDVIRTLRGRGRTTLLTTHYMDEAERLCDRVAIIDQGRVIALGSPAELIARIGGEHIVEFAIEGNAVGFDSTPLGGLASVTSVRNEADGFALTAREPHRTIPALLDHLASSNLPLARLSTRHVSLEDVFVSLTGRHLRDEEVAEGGKGREENGKRSRRWRGRQ
jgi:ABC-2 type transport system ATP-binding protein